MPRKNVCRECGCTDANCRQCIAKTGSPCRWIEKDLCSACAGYVERGDEIPMALRDATRPERFAACQSKHRGSCWGRVEDCARCGKGRCFEEGTSSLCELCDDCWGLVANSKAFWPTIEAAELQAERIADVVEARRAAAAARRRGEQTPTTTRPAPAIPSWHEDQLFISSPSEGDLMSGDVLSFPWKRTGIDGNSTGHSLFVDAEGNLVTVCGRLASPRWRSDGGCALCTSCLAGRQASGSKVVVRCVHPVTGSMGSWEGIVGAQPVVPDSKTLSVRFHDPLKPERWQVRKVKRTQLRMPPTKGGQHAQ